MALPHHKKEQQIASRQRRPLAHVSRKTNAAQNGSKGRK
jgi:hypothetical protein